MKYPVLMTEMKRRKTDLAAVAESLAISHAELLEKLCGAESFTWAEALRISRYFPDMNKTELFREADDIVPVCALKKP